MMNVGRKSIEQRRGNCEVRKIYNLFNLHIIFFSYQIAIVNFFFGMISILHYLQYNVYKIYIIYFFFLDAFFVCLLLVK